tara:strand:+ start:565 stop:1455 length:891 start_codon:yes stop_codon:yes gene_type:complete
MALKTENFLRRRVISSKISIFLAITFSVLIMGILGTLGITNDKIGKKLKENVEFNLIINNSTPEIEIQQLIRHLSVDVYGVKSVTYISKEQAAIDLVADLGEDFLDILDENPLSDIIEVRFNAEYLDTVNIGKKKKILKEEYTEIDEVIYNETVLSSLELLLSKLSIVFLLITFIFFIIAVILINSNIRLTIYARRFSIKTMQLVGATKSFIQKPFLISNLKYAILACIFGNTILIISISILMNRVFQNEILEFVTLQEILYLVLITSIINIGISFSSTWICVRKYLNLKTEELYK